MKGHCAAINYVIKGFLGAFGDSGTLLRVLIDGTTGVRKFIPSSVLIRSLSPVRREISQAGSWQAINLLFVYPLTDHALEFLPPVFHRCVSSIVRRGNSLDIRFHVFHVRNERRNLHHDQKGINRGAKDDWSKCRNNLKRSGDFLLRCIETSEKLRGLGRRSLYKRAIINSVWSISFRGVIVADSLGSSMARSPLGNTW